MEALLREPDEEMIQAGDAGCAKEFGGKEWRTKFVVGEFSIHAEASFPAMSAALLAKIEKEKE